MSKDGNSPGAPVQIALDGLEIALAGLNLAEAASKDLHDQLEEICSQIRLIRDDIEERPD